MGLSPLLYQTAGSLAAILALAGLAYWLKLGGAPSLHDEATLRAAANEICDGFDPVAVAVCEAGEAALARDAQSRIMLIRRHGSRFVGRILDARAIAGVTGDQIEIDCGEIRFGKARLTIGEAGTWADAVNRVGLRGNA